MSNYESVLIARQDLGTSQVNNIVSELSDVIKKEGGEVVKVDNWGLKTWLTALRKPQGPLCSDEYLCAGQRHCRI